MRGLLNENKKIMFRYRGTGKFAVAKKRRQDEAIERNNAYQKQNTIPTYLQGWCRFKLIPI